MSKTGLDKEDAADIAACKDALNEPSSPWEEVKAKLGLDEVDERDDGELCFRCGERYKTVWRAPDSLWITLVAKRGGGGLLCPRCFDARARLFGYHLMWECAEGEYPTDRIAS